MVGFASAARLAPRLQRALDVVAGKDAAALPDARHEAEGATTPGSAPDRAAVRLAELRGAAFLRRAWRRGFTGNVRFRPDELVLFAWAASGLDRADSDVAALLASVLESPPVGTYRAALRACALERLALPELRSRVEECARFLESTQLDNGQWSYGLPADGTRPELGDGSNSAYALLGLAACERAGVRVPDDDFSKAARACLAIQNSDGGFGYRADRESASYASMTASALHGLALASAHGAGETAHALARGGAWLRARFSVRDDPGSAYREGRQLYGLYALERIGDEVPETLPAARRGLPDDWYEQGAAYLLATQGGDGSWDDGSDTPVPNTCFALLFLARATRAVR